jgi:8-oxo-dGTP pyrophosphatase MutT (NUDIX family)
VSCAAGRRPGGRQIVPRPHRWTPGPPAPWEVGSAPSLADVLAAIPEVDRPSLPSFPGARHSAVLVTLAEGPRGPEVLLTRRSWKLRNHRGEISFPGGRTDPGESPVETALREAHEEVGLDPSLVTVHGELEHLNTVVSRSYIVPKVATVAEPLPLEAQTMEVDRVLWVPLDEFTRPDTYRSEVWGVGPTDRTLHFFELDDETVWGATAHVLVDLLRRTLA